MQVRDSVLHASSLCRSHCLGSADKKFISTARLQCDINFGLNFDEENFALLSLYISTQAQLTMFYSRLKMLQGKHGYQKSAENPVYNEDIIGQVKSGKTESNKMFF